MPSDANTLRGCSSRFPRNELEQMTFSHAENKVVAICGWLKAGWRKMPTNTTKIWPKRYTTHPTWWQQMCSQNNNSWVQMFCWMRCDSATLRAMPFWRWCGTIRLPASWSMPYFGARQEKKRSLHSSEILEDSIAQLVQRWSEQLLSTLHTLGGYFGW